MNQKETILSPIQARLTALPAALDLTHEQVSAYLGVSPHTLRKWISGERDPGALLLRTLDLLDLVRTLTPGIHGSIVSDCRLAVPVRPKGKPGRKTGQKIKPKFPQNFPHARAQANLSEDNFPETAHARSENLVDPVENLEPTIPKGVAPQSSDPDDVFVWPDGTWCYRHESGEFGFTGDDFRVLHADTPEWEKWPEIS